ncbi:uncharacterized protein LOC123273653 [Cotesia glomerata]|uniref:uncharacterized protein LOC123273653 n=1 Tax=Cotesia glomerata TaxID=32391 RepID=UPI001D02D360|nr:uncharacterized protein LOC123273653 [Cotesia glomerata]
MAPLLRSSLSSKRKKPSFEAVRAIRKKLMNKMFRYKQGPAKKNKIDPSSISQADFTEEREIQQYLLMFTDLLKPVTSQFKELFVELKQNNIELQATLQNLVNKLTECSK